jgi:hypothetical protein
MSRKRDFLAKVLQVHTGGILSLGHYCQFAR